MARRADRLRREWRRVIADAYADFSDGVANIFANPPHGAAAGEASIRRAFEAIYPVLEWCRGIRTGGKALSFLDEIRSAAPMSTAFAGVGIFDGAYLQLRYSVECLLSYLYFRDHPRELELAASDNDIWELTRPSAVIRFLRRLPEFESQVGGSLLNQLYTLYQDLCKHAHPRAPHRLRLRKDVAAVNPNAADASEYCDAVKRLSRCSCGLLRLSNGATFKQASELTQHIMMRGLPADWRRRVEKAAGT